MNCDGTHLAQIILTKEKKKTKKNARISTFQGFKFDKNMNKCIVYVSGDIKITIFILYFAIFVELYLISSAHYHFFTFKCI